METSIWRLVLYLFGFMVFAAVNVAYLGWCEHRGAGHIQPRTTPKEAGWFGLLQPVADGLTLMTKQLFIPHGVDGVLFRLTPVLAMIPALTSMVAIPFSANIQARAIDLSVLFLFSLVSLGMIALLLGGWASANTYILISSARAVSQSIAYEIPMLITVITIVMISGSVHLGTIAEAQQGGFWRWNIFPRLDSSLLMPVSFLIFFICSIAETNRALFDMAEVESELVTGPLPEYSPMGFAPFVVGEYLNIVVGACLTTILFLGGWGCPLGKTPGVWWFLAKIYLLMFIFIWVRRIFSRTQVYPLLNLSWKIMIPLSLVNLLLAAIFIKVF
ncbi:MAG: NADH-quinone oxidoreductase subunit H [Deltaproteobacteria bacterium]|nr:MAG: NADH-quinone oxidoreductase subunit H [Deltaproteobacteria bacterium]